MKKEYVIKCMITGKYWSNGDFTDNFSKATTCMTKGDALIFLTTRFEFSGGCYQIITIYNPPL